MERRGAEHDVERLVWQRPAFEGGCDHLDGGEASQVTPRDGRQLGSELDRDDLTAALGQWHGRLAGPAADLQHPAARPDAGQLGQVVEHCRGVARPRSIVPLGVLVEGHAEARGLLGGDVAFRSESVPTA